MTFAWEPLTLLLYKPLLKCFASRLCLLVEGIEPSSAGAWRHWSRLRNHCQGLTFTSQDLYTIGTCKQFMGHEEYENKNNRNLQNHSVVWEWETGWFNTKHQHYWASIILQTISVTVSNKMWSYPFNIAQSLTYKPATSAWGCNTVSSNTDSTQTTKKGQKWAYCVEALGVI